MIYLNFCEKIWLWMTPMMFGGRLESQIWGRTCSAWAILRMSFLMILLETNFKVEAKVEVWMRNLPYVQCGQGGVQPHFKGFKGGYGGSKFASFFHNSLNFKGTERM